MPGVSAKASSPLAQLRTLGPADTIQNMEWGRELPVRMQN